MFYDYSKELDEIARDERRRMRPSYNLKHDGGAPVSYANLGSIAECIREAYGMETAKSFLRNF